jgi:hypothetical protein
MSTPTAHDDLLRHSPSVPGSAWDRTALQALPAFSTVEPAEERQSLSGSTVPGRAWDRGFALLAGGRASRAIMIVITVLCLSTPQRSTAQDIQIPNPPQPLNLPVHVPPPPQPSFRQVAPVPAFPPLMTPPPAAPPAPRDVLPVSQEQPKKTTPDTLTYPHHDGDIIQIQRTQLKEDQEISLPSGLPGPDALFGPLRSEAQWKESIRQEAKRFGVTRKVIFPETYPLTTAKFQQRHWEPSVEHVTPNYLLHDRLLFEQPNFERYGWNLGPLGPPVELGSYVLDLALAPYRMFSRPLDQIDGSAGKYLPGDNVPLMIYPDSFSLTGLTGLAGVYMFGPFIYK